jgi:hypothetical protein
VSRQFPAGFSSVCWLKKRIKHRIELQIYTDMIYPLVHYCTSPIKNQPMFVLNQSQTPWFILVRQNPQLLWLKITMFTLKSYGNPWKCFLGEDGEVTEVPPFIHIFPHENQEITTFAGEIAMNSPFRGQEQSSSQVAALGVLQTWTGRDIRQVEPRVEYIYIYKWDRTKCA